MSHKADRSFFEEKRPWSRRKDQVLGFYLTPYIPKIVQLKRPILIVDGFAGPGAFGDGEPGSPLIILKALREAKCAIPSGSRALFVEANDQSAHELRERVASESYAEVRHSTFEDVVPELMERCPNCSTLLYLDPFTVKGLAWASLQSVFELVRRHRSVEVLLNFNVLSAVRWACAAIGRTDTLAEMADSEPGQPLESPSAMSAGLTRALGGDWWQEMTERGISGEELCRSFTQRFCGELQQVFKEVCWHEVRESWSHKIPKYVLVFASRNRDALELMNDAMAGSREIEAEQAVDPAQGSLFETRPKRLVSTESELLEDVLECARIRQTRDDLIRAVMRRHFCMFKKAQIRGVIEQCLKNGSIVSATGKSTVNKDVVVWRRE